MSEDMSTIAGLLQQALRAVEEANIPEDLRGAAFAKAFDAISGGSVPPVKEADGTPETEGTGGRGSAGSELGRIGARLAIDADSAESSYDVDEGQIRLTIPARKLNPQKSRATKEIALLVAAGRQAAELEERTEVGVIRDVVSDYGKLDPPNFAATIREMDEDFIISGQGQQRRVKVNRTGFERAGELIKEIQAR